MHVFKWLFLVASITLLQACIEDESADSSGTGSGQVSSTSCTWNTSKWDNCTWN